MENANKLNKNHIVCEVMPGSCADKAGIMVGDELERINSNPIHDIFDYRYAILDNHLEIDIVRDGQKLTVALDKDEDEDPGMSFESGLMDEYRRCRNNCIFCFIDQMPKGMRETLYFKDDDQRLSFLQGNYVTLTNLSDEDVDRIIKFRMEPINISFQTTNPELRCKMLNNRFAGESLKIVDRFHEAEISMNGQIVLCKGINDKEELIRSIEDLMKYLPTLQSVSVVPVGLTKYRDGLYPLEPFDKEDADEVISIVEKYQKICMAEHNVHFVHASDEWYILAGREIPPEDSYDGYLQLENGVGMIRLLCEEFTECFESCKMNPIKKAFMKPYNAIIATGKLAFPYIKKFADMVMCEYPRINLCVVPITNNFFGEMITVSGLITGNDLIEQIKAVIDKTSEYANRNSNANYDRLLIPINMLRSGEEVFLDDVTVSDVESKLNLKVTAVGSSGSDLFDAMLGRNI